MLWRGGRQFSVSVYNVHVRMCVCVQPLMLCEWEVISLERCVYSSMYTDLFELVVHTGDRHWKLESRKTAYNNVRSVG